MNGRIDGFRQVAFGVLNRLFPEFSQFIHLFLHFPDLLPRGGVQMLQLLDRRFVDLVAFFQCRIVFLFGESLSSCPDNRHPHHFMISRLRAMTAMPPMRPSRLSCPLPYARLVGNNSSRLM